MDTKIIRELSDENVECKKMGYKNWIQWGLMGRGINLRPDWEHPQGELPAAVSKSRWYVKCPYENCRINIPINELEPVVFCPDCLNVINDHKPYHVKWQNLNDLKMVLGVRKDYKQRNYLPHLGETHDDLEKENKHLVNGVFYGILNT